MKPDLIICGDLHLRQDTPICRTDDFLEVQRNCLQKIKALKTIFKCTIVCTGDVFHHWEKSKRPSSAFWVWLLENIPFMYAIAGNHDLPSKSFNSIEDSPLNVLSYLGKIRLIHDYYNINIDKKLLYLKAFHYGDKIESAPAVDKHGPYLVALVHKLINHPSSGTTSNELIKAMPGFDLIATGDNHQSFTDSYKGCILINPGCMTRQKTDEANYTPTVYLWNTKGEVEAVNLNEDCPISRKHIEVKEEKEKRFTELTDKMQQSSDNMGIAFENNLKVKLEESGESKQVKTMIWESVEHALKINQKG